MPHSTHSFITLHCKQARHRLEEGRKRRQKKDRKTETDNHVTFTALCTAISLAAIRIGRPAGEIASCVGIDVKFS